MSISLWVKIVLLIFYLESNNTVGQFAIIVMSVTCQLSVLFSLSAGCSVTNLDLGKYLQLNFLKILFFP